MLVNQDNQPLSSAELEEILAQAEVSKDIPVDDKLWERLDAKIEVDVHRRKSRRYKRFSMVSTAACILLLFGIGFYCQQSQHDSKKFVIEEMPSTLPISDVYSIEDVYLLYQYNYSCGLC